MTCDYCDQPAAWISTYGGHESREPLCTACARDHYADEWRDNVRRIGKRDLMIKSAI